MVNVLGIPLYNFNIPSIVNEVIDEVTCAAGKRLNRLISATGAHGLIVANKDAHFKKILSGFYYNLPDGIPSVWIGRLKGAKHMERCYGPDFFKALIQQSADKPINHFFCGGKTGVADTLKKNCADRFKNFNVTGTFCPPFREMSEAELNELGKKINDSGTHIVWIGLSTPKQEKFAYKLKNYTNVNFIITVGAAFDFHTDNVQQAPAWIQRSGFEWLFRLVQEPKRLYKRYLEIVPLFIWLNCKELILLIGKAFKQAI